MWKGFPLATVHDLYIIIHMLYTGLYRLRVWLGLGYECLLAYGWYVLLLKGCGRKKVRTGATMRSVVLIAPVVTF